VQGNLGGVVGANGLCSTYAAAASLPGVFKAWVSDTSTTPSTTFTQSAVPYKTTTGMVVAANWNALMNMPLTTPIQWDETGALVPGGPQGQVWTGTLIAAADGGGNATVLGQPNCNNWTSLAPQALVGEADRPDVPGWFALGVQGCDVQHHLYCFQQ